MQTRNVNVTAGEMVRNGGLQAPPRAIRVAPLLLIAALLLGGCGEQPEVVSRVDHEGIEMTTLRSPALEGNLLGEAPEKLVAVYLPPGYEEEKERTYAVVYYLHGFGFGPTKLARVKPHLDTYFEMRPEDAMIVVAVDGNTEPGGSFWRNSPIIGDWADFAAEEVPEFVEDEYRVADTRRARGLAGFSMGASAAIHLAVSRPDHYGAVFATGPAMPPVEDPRRFMEGIGYPKTASTIAAVAYEAFLTEEGALDRSAYEEAAVTDEVMDLLLQRMGPRAIDHMLTSGTAADRFSAEVYVEYGTFEGEVIREAARDVADVLDDHGVEYRLVEFEGGHAMAAGRFAEVLVPYFARTLES